MHRKLPDIIVRLGTTHMASAHIVRRHEELERRLQQLQGEYERASAALDAAVVADGGELAAARAAAEAAAAEVIFCPKTRSLISTMTPPH